MSQQTTQTTESSQSAGPRQRNSDIVELVAGVLTIVLGVAIASVLSFGTYAAGLGTHAAFSATMLLGGLGVFVGHFESPIVTLAAITLGAAVWALPITSGAIAMAGAGLAVGAVVFGGAAVFEGARRRLVGEPALSEERNRDQN